MLYIMEMLQEASSKYISLSSHVCGIEWGHPAKPFLKLVFHTGLFPHLVVAFSTTIIYIARNTIFAFDFFLLSIRKL